jgi:hypothetical protein
MRHAVQGFVDGAVAPGDDDQPGAFGDGAPRNLARGSRARGWRKQRFVARLPQNLCREIEGRVSFSTQFAGAGIVYDGRSVMGDSRAPRFLAKL